jgi:hypothetical protein
LQTFAIVMASALTMIAIPGWLASRNPPAISLQD